jgi:hypothetical protein
VSFMPWKGLAIAAALALGAANTSTDTAFGRGLSGAAHFVGGEGHFVGGGFAGHRLVINQGFVRRFRRSFATGFWPYWPYYYYDYTPPAAYGDMTTATYPGTDGLAPEALSAPACHRSEEIVTVPSEEGGSREIKITRCP